MAQESVSASYNQNLPGQGSAALASETHARVASAMASYLTPEERLLAIENVKWLSAHAPTISDQMRCRMLLLAMRNWQSFRGAA